MGKQDNMEMISSGVGFELGRGMESMPRAKRIGISGVNFKAKRKAPTAPLSHSHMGPNLHHREQ